MLKFARCGKFSTTALEVCDFYKGLSMSFVLFNNAWSLLCRAFSSIINNVVLYTQISPNQTVDHMLSGQSA